MEKTRIQLLLLLFPPGSKDELLLYYVYLYKMYKFWKTWTYKGETTVAALQTTQLSAKKEPSGRLRCEIFFKLSAYFLMRWILSNNIQLILSCVSTAMLTRDIDIAILSVCLSVAFRYGIKMV